MKIKVCGIREHEQFNSLDEMKDVDYVGCIFYSKSKRYVNSPTPRLKHTKKVGVFVNASEEEVRSIAERHQLTTLQFHGDESPDFCAIFKSNFEVIKAFGIDDNTDFNDFQKYEEGVDYFLFDTKTSDYGGSGKQFNWELLNEFKFSKPFFLSGGIAYEAIAQLKEFNHSQFYGIDLNSGFEISPANKDLSKIKIFCSQMKQPFFKPDELGFYGDFGGAYIPELLRPNVEALKKAYNEASKDENFHNEMRQLLKDYVGRPTPLYQSLKLSNKYNCKVLLKREDLNHTGSHKINNTIGQILLAKRMGKTDIIAETGAGQHGVATATVCALLDMNCIVYMGEKDMKRQAPNVQRMNYLGAEVRPATSGSKTLKDATNEAIRHWINHPDSYYLIGSVVGPHPYPQLVAEFQSIISEEIQYQLKHEYNIEQPTKVIACVGGGSNAAGAFYHFYENTTIELYAVEAAGLGIDSGYSAATSILGKPGILHGSLTYLMQDELGQVTEPHSISAGLDYPGIGPLHAHTIDIGRTISIPVTDQEALYAASLLSKMDGIIPALESAHAIAALEKLNLTPNDVVIVNLSGRGDKDLEQLLNY